MLEWLQTNLAEMRAEQRRLVPVVAGGRELAAWQPSTRRPSRPQVDYERRR